MLATAGPMLKTGLTKIVQAAENKVRNSFFRQVNFALTKSSQPESAFPHGPECSAFKIISEFLICIFFLCETKHYIIYTRTITLNVHCI